jgi:GST-like protein
VAVEAALTLIGAPYEVSEVDWRRPGEELVRVNPMRQLPAIILPSGEVMTESAAILIQLADSHPQAGLSPAADSPLRPRFLRWMSFVASQVYALYWLRDAPSRIVEGPEAEALVKARTEARITECWRIMGEQLEPRGRFLLGDEVSVLDLYLAVVSRWGPRRKAFYAAAPRLAACARAVDAEPRLESLWAERMPFVAGWEG